MRPMQSVNYTYLGKQMQQTLWPDHCVEDTWGAQFPVGLPSEKFDVVLKKVRNDLPATEFNLNRQFFRPETRIWMPILRLHIIIIWRIRSWQRLFIRIRLRIFISWDWLRTFVLQLRRWMQELLGEKHSFFCGGYGAEQSSFPNGVLIQALYWMGLGQ